MVNFRPGGSADVRGQNLNRTTQRSNDGSLSRSELTDLGNYNFGVAGAARGYELNDLLSIGDIDQHGIIPGIGKQGCYFCVPKDNPRDTQLIQRGFIDYQSGHLK